ncbi:hypothetical protein [Acidiphilium iwatense]|uniref:Uncharacterized protein n=1 Tax=Acidiphilium iwatense TaxID=768198 RepID=A0ABS9DYJ3_9PROT|nr:hypothetical protein [Acidiphilium iwatense]MCF3947754.1 hypothetical protein [Acidiphilium iwatense]
MTKDFIAIRDRIENAIIAGIDRAAAKRRRRDAITWITPTAREFNAGPVTPEMARHAESVSQFHYRKRLARAAVAR